MATRASVTVKYGEDDYRTIYVHFDGYPEGLGKTLNGYYRTLEQAKSLIELGDCSEVKQTPEMSYPYHGRGEDWDNVKPRRYTYFLEAIQKDSQEYNYLFENDCWTVRC